MRTQIPSTHYYTKEVFQIERKSLAEKCWSFFCFTTDLSQDKNYLVQNIFGNSVFVQNFRGQLKAFSNVCPHRFNQIKCNSKGSSHLVCSYHGWTFDEDGKAIGIPHKIEFEEFKKSGCEIPSLQAWSLEVCGIFVFVKKISDDTLSLKEYLGKYFDELLNLSQAMGKELPQLTQQIQANWKICVENTLESYHVHLIHPHSFKKLGVKGEDFQFDQLHSSWNGEVGEKYLEGWKRIEKVFNSRPIKIEGYKHFFIFPNFTIATTFGASFSFQNFFSPHAEETNFVSRIFMTSLENKKSEVSALFQHMSQTVADFNQTVFQEDQEICEKVHLGTQMAYESGWLGESEKRVFDFQNQYMKVITGDEK